MTIRNLCKLRRKLVASTKHTSDQNVPMIKAVQTIPVVKERRKGQMIRWKKIKQVKQE